MKFVDRITSLWKSKADGIRKEGRVKWFNLDKGFGFASCPTVPDDVFLHITQFRGYPKVAVRPREGSPITFTMQKTDKGFRAMDVMVTV